MKNDWPRDSWYRWTNGSPKAQILRFSDLQEIETQIKNVYYVTPKSDQKLSNPLLNSDYSPVYKFVYNIL